MLQVPFFYFRARIVSPTRVSEFLRGLMSIGVAALLLIAPFGFAPRSFNVSAQQISGSKTSARNHFILYQDTAGNVACRAATLAEASELDKGDTSIQGLQQINHLQSDRYAHRTSRARTSALSGTNLTIILRATAQLDGNTAAKNAFIRAAQNWETIIFSPITIYIDVDFGPNNSFNNNQPFPAGVLGSTSTIDSFYPYSLVRANLVAEANGEGNATKQAIFNALPSTSVPTDLGNAGTIDVNSSIARAIGLSPAVAQSSDFAPQIAFNSNSNSPYDFDPSDNIDSGSIDFDAVATHEIGHALGFESDAGFSSTTATPSIWDLYRFRTGTSSGTFSTAQRVMTIGGSPDPLQFDFIPGNSELGLSNGGPSQSSTNGADGWQSSHWKHASTCLADIGIMDPAIPTHCRRTITVNDQLALTSFGYNLTNSNPPPGPPPPPANDNFANAQVISGCSGSVNGINIGSTRETGEPNNPDSPTSKTSVWYQWQAPSTGSVTIDTIGSDFDTVLAVYTGNTLGGLTLVANNDDRSQTPHEITSLVTFTATQGTIYRIAVSGFDNSSSGGDIGDIQLNWTEANCSVTQPPPTIMTEEGATTKAAAFDSVTFLRGPFTVVGPNNFSSDQHTRVILFTSPLGLTIPDPAQLTVQAGSTLLTVENVGTVTGVAGLTASYIVVRLPTGLATGNLPLTVTLHGVASSNNPTLGIQ
jgi:hypothetical protein